MNNKRQYADRDSRRSSQNNQSNQRNYAAEDAKKRFQDQDYDNYFPEQNSYHPRNLNVSDYGQGQQNYGSRSGVGYGSGQDYSDNQNMGQHYGSDNQSQRRNSEYPSYRQSNRSDSDFSPRAGSFSNQNSYGQESTQSWSQPVRNDEVYLQPTKSHFGKGPKGFKRSDERIREEVSEALFRDNAVDASEVEVNVRDGEVTLSGTVEDRRMKRLAEDCAESVSGVNEVRNEIRVQSQRSTSEKPEARSAVAKKLM